MSDDSPTPDELRIMRTLHLREPVVRMALAGWLIRWLEVNNHKTIDTDDILKSLDDFAGAIDTHLDQAVQLFREHSQQ
jgi:hypothetical protein